jgi:hypothetical protein
MFCQVRQCRRDLFVRVSRSLKSNCGKGYKRRSSFVADGDELVGEGATLLAAERAGLLR